MNTRTSLGWSILGALPLVGRLREVSKGALSEAWSEILTTTIFAAMPLWFPLLAGIIMVEAPNPYEALGKGELLIYAATLVGPLAYILTKRYGRYETPAKDGGPVRELSVAFPYGRLCVIVAMLICLASGFVITLQKLESAKILAGIKLINPFGLTIFSILVFVLATMLLFCVSAYRNMIEELDKPSNSEEITSALKKSEDEAFAEWLRKQRGE